MRLLRQLRALSATDRRLLFEVVLTVCVIRIGLLAFSFQRLNGILNNDHSHTCSKDDPALFARKVSRFVRKVSAYIPGATCLTQALATTKLLRKFGYPASVRIGVAKTPQDQLQAHAWVELEKEIVIGVVPDLTRYTVLTPVKREIA
jgi:hypothetical protein